MDTSNGVGEQNMAPALPSVMPAQTNPDPQVSGDLPGFKHLFSEAWALMKKRVLVMILSSLWLISASVFVAALIFFGGLMAFMFGSKTAGVLIWVVLGVAWTVGYIYVANWAAAAQLVALRDAEENTGTKENIKRSRQFAWSMLLVNLLLQLVVMGGFFLFIIPGIILGLYYGLAMVILVAEGKKGRSALAQSKAYIKGRAGKVFGKYFLFFLSVVLPMIALQIVIAIGKGTEAEVAGRVIYMVAQFVLTYLSLAFVYVMYKHLKATAPSADGQKYVGGVTGWAVWGGVAWVLFVVLIVGSVVLLALSSARSKSRDAKRIGDVRQLMSALELYNYDHQGYPNNIQELTPTYIVTIPESPKPTDGNCFDQANNYVYVPESMGQDYKLSFCLGGEISGYSAGNHSATKDGMK